VARAPGGLERHDEQDRRRDAGDEIEPGIFIHAERSTISDFASLHEMTVGGLPSRART
jgi:hypothetical protein